MNEIVRKEDSAAKGAWVIERDGEVLAALHYTTAGSRVILDHTEVSDKLRGSGAGKRLVEAAVQWARGTSAKLMPLCPFAKSVFDKVTEWHDVLA